MLNFFGIASALRFRSFLSLTLASSLLLLSFAAHADHEVFKSQQGVVIYGFDPVAYFTQGKATEGSKDISVEFVALVDGVDASYLTTSQCAYVMFEDPFEQLHQQPSVNIKRRRPEGDQALQILGVVSGGVRLRSLLDHSPFILLRFLLRLVVRNGSHRKQSHRQHQAEHFAVLHVFRLRLKLIKIVSLGW